MANVSDSDRNTEAFEHDGSQCPGPGCGCPDCVDSRKQFMDGPDGHAEVCIYCRMYPVKAHSDYCSDGCAIAAAQE